MESTNRFPGLPSGVHLPAVRILLTEDAIKRAFVGFLKTFDRDRYEIDPDSFQASLDNVGKGGLVADGMLRFRQTNGKFFTCAYEATSRERIDEVRFTLNVAYFLWDCAAFGAVVMALGYAAFYATRLRWLVELKWAGNVGMLIGIWLMGFLLWYFTMRSWRKYRYIYAIEQFKQYFADDQWVVLGDDVFPSPLDPYRIELREQSTYNGFGLAIVDADAKVRVLVSPSRLDFYGKDRRIVEWFTQSQWYQAVTQNARVLKGMRPTLPSQGQVFVNKIVRPLQYLIWEPSKKFLWQAMQQPLSDSNVAFERFMTGHRSQKWVFFLSLIVTGVIGWEVAHFKGEEAHMSYQDIRNIYEGKNPEDYPYVITGEPIPYQGGIVKQSVEAVEEDVPTIDLSRDAEPTKPLPTKLEQAERAIGQPVNPCGVLEQSGWVVIDEQFVNRLGADTRIADLRVLGFEATVAPSYCIEKGKTGYVVYLNTIYPQEQQAREVLERFTAALSKGKRTIPNHKPTLKQLR
jgi:hypothetical protein